MQQGVIIYFHLN